MSMRRKQEVEHLGCMNVLSGGLHYDKILIALGGGGGFGQRF